MNSVITSITLASKDVEMLDQLVEKGCFLNRGDAIRTMVRSWLDDHNTENEAEGCNTDTKP